MAPAPARSSRRSVCRRLCDSLRPWSDFIIERAFKCPPGDGHWIKATRSASWAHRSSPARQVDDAPRPRGLASARGIDDPAAVIARAPPFSTILASATAWPRTGRVTLRQVSRRRRVRGWWASALDCAAFAAASSAARSSSSTPAAAAWTRGAPDKVRAPHAMVSMGRALPPPRRRAQGPGLRGKHRVPAHVATVLFNRCRLRGCARRINCTALQLCCGVLSGCSMRAAV